MMAAAKAHALRIVCDDMVHPPSDLGFL